MGIVVTSNVPELGQSSGGAPVQMCSCSLCSAAAANGTVAPHAMAAALSTASETRGATFIDQYRDANGFYNYSGDRNIDAVLIGTKWTGTNLTFSFPDSGAVYGSPYDFGQPLRQVPFNDAQKEAARDAFGMIAGYTNLTFTEIAPDSAERPTIRLSSTQLQDVGSAMGYFPGISDGVSGDIWFGRTQQPYYEAPERGNWGYVTVLHEIGHTMGLKHGHSDYTNDDLGSYFGIDRSFYGTRALEYAKDGQAWSLMSYTNGPNSIPVYNGDERNSAQTYMMYDIAALQYLYGANYKTNAGDTVYSWDPETGTMSINGVAQKAPSGNKVFETIWDGGGNDTYDLSNYTGNLSLDLRPGELSTISSEQLANTLAYIDGDIPVSGNIGNALMYKGNTASLIENAIGGSGNDVIVGNQVNNRIDGGAGNDVLVGGKGSDLLIGGDGNDVADFSDVTSGINIYFNNNTADIIVANGKDRDVIRGVEGAVGTAFNDNLVGDKSDNFLSGGSGGRDYLNGGDGNDTLIGATDTVVVADKPNIVKAADYGNYSRATALNLDGTFDLSASTIVERSTTIPHTTINATAPGGAVDVYSFTATAGASAIFDIDNAAPYGTAIQILDQYGNVVASNYGIAESDGGSRDGGTPMLDYIFQQSGTYYVRVGRMGIYYDDYGNPVNYLGGFDADTPYTLNVSVEGAKVDSTVTAIGSGKFYAGAGDDLIVASSGDDLIKGDAGNDTLSYANARAGVTVALANTKAQATGGAGTDTITGIENLTGSKFDDVLTGDKGNNIISGGTGGTDVLNGGAGIDTLSFASLTRDAFFDLSRQGIAQSVQPGARITATGFENLEGGKGNDYLVGDSNTNIIRGGAGDDTLQGITNGRVTGGGSINGIDTLDGGTGFDTATFGAHGVGIKATMTGGGTGSVVDAKGVALAKLTGIEAIEGTGGDDVITGDADANTLVGSGGADTLTGGAGDDTLNGGFGDDIVAGGDGVDTAVYAGWGTHFVDLSRTGAQDTGEGSDTITGIENLKGGWGDDFFFGSADDNVFTDVGGDDMYVGRGGSDTVDYSSATKQMSVDLRIEFQQDTRGAGWDLLSGVENVIGGDAGNFLYGNTANNRLVGGADTDVLMGGLGADRLDGGDGNDLLLGDEMNLADNPGGLATNDVLAGGRGADRLIGGEGDDVLMGGSGGDILVGGAAVVVQTGNIVRLDALILGDGGQDTLDGGDGDDYGVLFYAGRDEKITIDNRDLQAVNNVYFDGVAHGYVTSIETLRFYGGDNDDVVYTGVGYDLLQGGAGNDYLSAGEGDDVVNGGDGDDFLDGGYGFDMLSYGNATAGVRIDLRITEAQDTGGAGIDTVRNFENITPTRFTDLVYGNDGSNTVRDNGGGDDTIYGLGGSDSLAVLRQYGDPACTVYLDGGEGSDVVEYYSSPVYNRFVPIEFYRQTDTVTLIGGDSRDGIWMVGQKVGVIDAGSGNDLVTIGIGGMNESSIDITLGSGDDILAIDYTDNYLGEIDRLNNIVRDFETGDDGDRVNMTYLQNYWDPTENPFAVDKLRLVQNGSDVQLQIDGDGPSGTKFEWKSFLTFQNTDVEDFTAHNFFRTTGDGQFDPIVERPWDPNGGPAVPTSVSATEVALQSAAAGLFQGDALDPVQGSAIGAFQGDAVAFDGNGGTEGVRPLSIDDLQFDHLSFDAIAGSRMGVVGMHAVLP